MLARLQIEPADTVIAFLKRKLQAQDAQEREEEEASPYFETPSLSIQLPSPFMTSWSNQDHNDAAEESDQLCSSSPADSSPGSPFQVQSYNRHNTQSPSSINHPSLVCICLNLFSEYVIDLLQILRKSALQEMELIYDLKGQIEQLHCEMAELRKSVLSCADLQMNMHQSFSRGKII